MGCKVIVFVCGDAELLVEGAIKGAAARSSHGDVVIVVVVDGMLAILGRFR